MAKNRTPGDNQRKRAVKARSQRPNPITGAWTKRDDKTGKLMDAKADPERSKGLRKEMHDTARRFEKAMKRLADR